MEQQQHGSESRFVVLQPGDATLHAGPPISPTTTKRRGGAAPW